MQPFAYVITCVTSEVTSCLMLFALTPEVCNIRSVAMVTVFAM
jgi:hypothetical protein